eukprot:TRINITY_DN6773_c0_g1_i2.p1 TRINITY_DN6773_c0_g1~~TRINITY_DN6773_c0_g1_i2.p1  ORF type:complete len:205 (-),score=23.95 TRINITY_DN6773_c0_g1_i2:134-748(-)
MISSQFYHINIQRVEITPEQSEESINNHLPMLKAHLTRASVNEDYQNYQLLENVVDEIIKEYLLLNKEPFDDGTGNESKTTLQYNVWSLVKALWGKHQGRFASNIDEYQDTLCRLFSVNQWFKSVCRPLVTREIGSIRDVEEGKRTNLYCIFQVKTTLVSSGWFLVFNFLLPFSPKKKKKKKKKKYSALIPLLGISSHLGHFSW